MDIAVIEVVGCSNTPIPELDVLAIKTFLEMLGTINFPSMLIDYAEASRIATCGWYGYQLGIKVCPICGGPTRIVQVVM